MIPVSSYPTQLQTYAYNYVYIYDIIWSYIDLYICLYDHMFHHVSAFAKSHHGNPIQGHLLHPLHVLWELDPNGLIDRGRHINDVVKLRPWRRVVFDDLPNRRWPRGSGELWPVDLGNSGCSKRKCLENDRIPKGDESGSWFFFGKSANWVIFSWVQYNLVGGWATPLNNISQLGWWHSQCMKKKCSKPPTSNH